MSLRLAQGPLMQQGRGGSTYYALVSSLGATHGWKMDEASGSLADFVGSLNFTTVGGTPAYSQTAIITDGGSSIDFDGSTDYFQRAADIALSPDGGAISIEAWINAPNANQVGGIYYCRLGSSPFLQWGLLAGYLNSAGAFTSGKQIGFVLIQNGGSGPARSWRTTGDVIDGNAHHIVVVSNGSSDVTFYVDGSAVAKTLEYNIGAGWPNVASNGSAPPEIGRNGGAGNYFDGIIDGVHLYKGVALSATNVSDLYDAGTA